MKNSESKILYSGCIDISYSSFTIEPENPDSLGGDEFAGQNNGLCGASVPGHLAFIARPRDAAINIDVVLHSKEPELKHEYTEVVEVSFERGKNPVLLCQWAHEEIFKLDLPKKEYRVRYSIKGLDKDYDEEILKPINGQLYLIEFWPSKFKEDKIIKETTEDATYWHKSHCKN